MPIIQYYIGESADFVEFRGDNVVFKTLYNMGILERNLDGNWDIYLGADKISEIEYSILKTVAKYSETPDIQDYYNDLNLLLNGDLGGKSRRLIGDLKGSIESLMLNNEIRYKSPLSMGIFYIFVMGAEKQIICLN